jgi:LPXTG-site transpeptidase (sortase) family protein
MVVAASIACIVAGIVIVAQLGWFLHDSSVHGTALIHRAHRAIAAAAADGAACLGPVGDAAAAGGPDRGPPSPRTTTQDRSTTPDRSGTPRGLLEAPSLGLVAPVREGASDSVLNDAVGHIPASAWPGHPGTSVFSAHDVTWFSRIDGLMPGDEIRYVTPCRTYTYRVTSHRIVPAGYAVYNTAIPSMVLDTCYPLDALYLTNARYLVYATLAVTSPTSLLPPPRASPVSLTVPAPRALAAQGLGLEQNEVPLGRLHLAGAPSPAWRETNAPLRTEAAALTAYFGVIRSAEQGKRIWWEDLAPSVPQPSATGLWEGEITGYDTRLDVTLRVQGDRALSATLTAVVTTADLNQSGTYDVTVTETATATGRLLVSGFTMRPASPLCTWPRIRPANPMLPVAAPTPETTHHPALRQEIACSPRCAIRGVGQAPAPHLPR